MKATKLLLLAALSAATLSRADVITWTNTGDGWWGVDANWSPNQAPSTNDVALITNAGTYAVWLNLSPTIAGLVLGGDTGTQTLSTAEQVLRLNGSGSVGARGVFKLANGALSGTGNLSVAGTFVWDGGTIDTNAGATIASDGQMRIGPGANYARILHGAVTNAGTILWQPSGGLYVGGVLHNLSAGLFETQWSPPIEKYGANPRIINDGVFRKTVDGGGMNCTVAMTVNGTVDVQTGALALGDGSVFNSGCQFLGAGVTRLDAGTNTLNGSLHSENLVLSGTTLNGTGSLSGVVRWSGGNIGLGAALLVATNGLLDISSDAEYGKVLLGNLTNAGVITWKPYGAFAIAGVLHNAAGGLFDIQNPNRDLAKWSGSALIINDGVFRKSSGVAGHACDVPIVNNGTVETQVGLLALADGSVFNPGCRLTGAGVAFSGAGTNTLNGRLYSENLVLGGTTLNGTGSLSGVVRWSGGNIGFGAALLVATNGLLDISSDAEYDKVLLGNLTNAGVITWKPYGAFAIAGVLHNAAGGLFEIQDPNRDLAKYGAGATLINQGVFRKSGSGGRTCSVPFTNHGTVEVEGGTLGFDGGYANPTGTIRLAGGALQLSQPLELAGGLLTGWGTVWPDVTNTATIRPARSNGVLTILGNYAQALGGNVEFELAGNTPGVDQSRLNITGAARLRGTISVRWGDGYLPEPGTNFPVMTFASRAGEFCCFDNFILLGQGRQLTPVCGATTLTLAAITAPEPTSVPLRLTVEGSALVCWPVEFAGYELLWSTNLGQTNWTLLPGVTNHFLEAPPLAREKFYRLHKP